MQCPCGGSTVLREQPRSKGGKIIAKVEFLECTACKRVGTRTLTSYNPETGKITSSVRI